MLKGYFAAGVGLVWFAAAAPIAQADEVFGSPASEFSVFSRALLNGTEQFAPGTLNSAVFPQVGARVFSHSLNDSVASFSTDMSWSSSVNAANNVVTQNASVRAFGERTPGAGLYDVAAGVDSRFAFEVDDETPIRITLSIETNAAQYFNQETWIRINGYDFDDNVTIPLTSWGYWTDAAIPIGNFSAEFTVPAGVYSIGIRSQFSSGGNPSFPDVFDYQAVIQSRLEIIPAPSAVSALVMGGLLAARRRRS